MANDAFKCGHSRSAANTKLIRNSTGETCRTCFRIMDRDYRRVKRGSRLAQQAQS